MKIRTGFVSNSSSSSFIILSSQLNEIEKLGEFYQKNFDKILFEINKKDEKDIRQYYSISEKEKEKLIADQKIRNKKTLKIHIKILKNIKDYIKEVDKNIFNELEYDLYSFDKDWMFFDESIFNNYYPFSARVFYLAQRLEKINKKLYNEVFNWKDYVKIKKLPIKNLKRIKYNDIIWMRFNNIYLFDYFLKREFILSKFEEKILQSILKQLKFEIILKYKKHIQKIKKNIYENNEKVFKVRFQDGGGCGIYAPWIESDFIKIPYILKINNH